MRRVALIAMMMTIFGLGMLAGSLFSSAARADGGIAGAAPGTNVVVNTPYAPYNTSFGYGPFGYLRWQIATIPVPGAQGRTDVVTILLDTQSGYSYVLRPVQGTEVGYRWNLLYRPDLNIPQPR